MCASVACASLFLVGLQGCSRSDKAGREETAAAELGAMTSNPTLSPSRSAGDTIVPQPIHWSNATVEATLRAAGFQPVAGSLHGTDPFPNVPAAVYRIGTAEVRTYFFGDPVAAARAMGEIAAPSSATTVFASNNMVVVVLAQNAATRERIRGALTVAEAQGAVNR